MVVYLLCSRQSCLIYLFDLLSQNLCREFRCCLHSHDTESRRTLWTNITFLSSYASYLCLSQGARSNFSAHNWWQSSVSRMDQKQHEGLNSSLIKMLMKLSKHLLQVSSVTFWIVCVDGI